MAICIVVPFNPDGWKNRRTYIPREEQSAWVIYRRVEGNQYYWFKWHWEKLKYSASHVRYQGHDWVAFKYQVDSDGDDWWDDAPDFDKPVEVPMVGKRLPFKKYADLDTGEGVQINDNEYLQSDTSGGDTAPQRFWLFEILQGALRLWKR